MIKKPDDKKMKTIHFYLLSLLKIAEILIRINPTVQGNWLEQWIYISYILSFNRYNMNVLCTYMGFKILYLL